MSPSSQSSTAVPSSPATFEQSEEGQATPSQQKAQTEARAAILATLSAAGSHYSTLTQHKAQDLHANSRAIAVQEAALAQSTRNLEKEGKKWAREAEKATKGLNRFGDLQNWAEMLERDLVVLEETLRLVERGEGLADGNEEEGEESRGDEVGSKKSVGKGAGAKPKKTAKGGNEKASNPDNFIRYPSTSPLHPTPSLLTTLAHAYGINNAIPTALKVIDHFSRCYALSIPHATWSELLEWTFVLSVPRTGQKAHHDGTRAGQLPLSAVGDLWETMTGGTTTTMKADGEGEVERKGYNVQPDMRMYDYLVKNLVLRDMGPEILDRMREGRDLYLRSRKAAKEAWQNLLYQGGIRERKGARKRQPLYDHVGKEWRWNQLKALKQKLKETPSLSPTTHPPPSSPPGTP
ncbi:hypothetical protein KC317_g9815, partial [Hortaea werneckii]